MDSSDPAAPKVVHGFLPRDSEGYHIEETWDALGMRATRSDDTVFEGCIAPTEKIARVLPAGPAGMDLFVLGIFAWALEGVSSVYYSIARRVLDMTLEEFAQEDLLGPAQRLVRPLPGVPARLGGNDLQDRPAAAAHRVGPRGLQRGCAQRPQLDRGGSAPLGRRCDQPQEDRHRARLRDADLGVELAGGFGVARKSEFERLFRDARMGRIYPASSPLAYEFVSKFALGGVGFGDQRWG